MLVEIGMVTAIAMSPRGHGECVLRKWRKLDSYCKVAKSLAELYSCCSGLWKIEFVSDETGYLTEEISKQSIEGAVGFLIACTKMRKERWFKCGIVHPN